MATRSEEVREYEELGLKCVREISHVLDTYHSDDAVARTRLSAAIAGGGMSTRFSASHNNRFELLLATLDRAGITSDALLEVVKAAGFLPESFDVAELSTRSARLLAAGSPSVNVTKRAKAKRR